MKRIVVTGGSGGSGHYVIQELLASGYDVLNIDITPAKTALCPYLNVDLTDYEAVYEAFKDYDSVIHFGANPNPDFDFSAGADRFKNNTLTTFNVFQAAVAHGFKRVVWASSETVMGFPFENVQPKAVPVLEDDLVLPQNAYAFSKVASEEVAWHMNAVYGISIISLRYTNILYTHTDHPANFAAIPEYWQSTGSRRFNLWGYIDARDAAVAARLALESDLTTSEIFTIAAEDTIMKQTNQELIAAEFPDTEMREGLGAHETLLSIEKAKRLLGFKPQYSWRNVLSESEQAD